MSKFFKGTIIDILAVILVVGGLGAADFTNYRMPFDTAHWHVTYNTFVTAVQTEITALSNLIINWSSTVDSLTLIQSAPTYSDDHTFSLPGDYTALLTANKRLVADCGAGGLQPNTVASCTYAAPNSTVVVNIANLTNNLSAVSYYATRNGLNTYGSGDVVAGEFGAPSWANLQAAVTVANASGRRLLLTPGTWPLNDHLIITAPVHPVPGAIISNAGYTDKNLPIEGSFEAGLYQVFDFSGTGKVAFGSGAVKEVCATWWYGGEADWLSAIQAALNTNQHVVLPDGVLDLAGTLRFRVNGQILRGSGGGIVSDVYGAKLRTTLRYTGTANGKMISLAKASGDVVMQECLLKDVALDGNDLANIGIEGYDDSSIALGGAWRNRFENVSLTGVTSGTTPTYIFLGTAGGATAFANDYSFNHVLIWGSGGTGVRGVVGKGAVYSFSGQCVIANCDGYGILASAGSAWILGNTIFHLNGWDFYGTSIQLCTADGAWFEGSTNGVYRSSLSHNLSLKGCHFATNNVSNLMNFGAAQGDVSITGCVVPGTTASSLITNVNSLSSYNIDCAGMTVEAGAVKTYVRHAMRSDQQNFMAQLTTDANNATGDGTFYTIIGYSGGYNLYGTLNTTSGVFTAPVDGYYQFSGYVTLGNIAAHTTAELYLSGGGAPYILGTTNPGVVKDASSRCTIGGTVTVALTAGQTAFLSVMVSGGAKTVSVLAIPTGTISRFEGRLSN